MGYNTYKQVSEFEIDYPYASKKSIIISSSEIAVSEKGVVVSTDAAEDVLRKLKLSDQNTWIIGGGATNARVHEAGLIDEMILTYLPITLGSGIPLFRSNNTETTVHNPSACTEGRWPTQPDGRAQGDNADGRPRRDKGPICPKTRAQRPSRASAQNHFGMPTKRFWLLITLWSR